MSPDHFLRPLSSFRIDQDGYFMYSEHSVLGIW